MVVDKQRIRRLISKYHLVIKDGNGKSPINGGFNRKIIRKWSIFPSHGLNPRGCPSWVPKKMEQRSCEGGEWCPNAGQSCLNDMEQADVKKVASFYVLYIYIYISYIAMENGHL